MLMPLIHPRTHNKHPSPLQSPPMRRYFPDFAAFSASAGEADVIPVYRQLLAIDSRRQRI